MNSLLSQQRCLNHAGREAVARCPVCHQCYCRECVTEHDDRLICAACLKKAFPPLARRRFRLARVLRAGQCALGMLTAWLFFYWMGQALLSIPTSFHEGTVWQGGWWEAE
ncbi:MAG: rhomboid family protein [Verrucomicrobiota bacterium]